MLHKWLEIASTPSVKAAREHYGSAVQYARLDGTLDRAGPVRNDRLGDAEAAFIEGRDGFYLASVSETGWPYVQYRGGPAGFLRVLDDHTLGFADFRGNRQYVTTGNVAENDRVSLFLMDYAHQRRLKIFGHLRMIDVSADPELARNPCRARLRSSFRARGPDPGCGLRLELPSAHHPSLHARGTGPGAHPGA